MNRQKERSTYVFLDTMVYLHCQPIHQMNLPDLLGVSSFTVVIPRITLQELDKHKNTHRSKKIRDRAGDRLKTIKSCMDSSSKELRSGVFLEYVAERPPGDFKQQGLDIDWPDDQLIACVLCLMNKNRSDRVVLITHDVTPELTAKHLGIEVAVIPDKWRFPPEDDRVLKENKQLRNELLRLKNAQPKLILRLGEMPDDEDRVEFWLPTGPRQIEVPDKCTILAKLRETYPEQLAAHAASIHPDTIRKGEYERYNRELEQFFSDYDRYLDRLADFQSQPDRTLKLDFEVRNVGAAPAEDIHIYVNFPDGFSLYVEGDIPREPGKPEPPVKPRTDEEMALRFFPRIDFAHSLLPTSALAVNILNPKNTFSLKKTGSYQLREHFERIKHGYLLSINPIFLIFDSYDNAMSFKFDYEIDVGNLPDPVHGSLNIIIHKHE